MRTSFECAEALQFASSAARKFTVHTTQRIEVKNLRFVNESTVQARQSILKNNESGMVLCIELQGYNQKSGDQLSVIMQEIVPFSNRIVFQADLHGNMLSILNKNELTERWIVLKKGLVKKYKTNHEALKFFDAYEQELANDETLVPSMKNKGVYGLLMPGVYGYDYGASFQRKINMKGFFNDIDLPLIIHSTPTPGNNQWLELTGTGTLDEEVFEEDAFDSMMKAAADDITFRVNCKCIYRESYTINRRDKLLSGASQYLKIEVPGVYYHEIIHRTEAKL